MLHRNVTLGGNHMAHNWEYADAAARLSATGFLGTDVGKLALQLDNNSLWILTDDSPVTWVDPSAAALAAKAAKAANLSDLASAAEARVNLNVATVAVAADEIDWALGEKFSKTLSANWSPTFANDDDGMTIIVRLTSGGAYSVTWPTVLWAGGVPPDQTPSGDDVYTFVKMGSDIIGSVVQDLA